MSRIMTTHPYSASARQAKKAAAEAVGIDEAYIGLMVESFYAQIRSDAMLGPIFNSRIKAWPEHLERMKQFWRSVLHNSGSFSGNPMLKHVAIPQIEAIEFNHWLSLFKQTLADTAPSEAAQDLILGRAHMIADSLLTGIRIHRDGHLASSMKDVHHA
ncbi:MAG: group III truncated hemoglobin [Sphingomonadales bacterium]|nr:group III truncated hemoglobin [Sphingomonadales bacterium]